MIKGGVTRIYISNMDRALRFYTGVLGLKLQLRDHNRWAALDAGNGMQIGLRSPHSGGPRPGQEGSTMVGFDVERPLKEVMAELKSQGIKLRGPVHGDPQATIDLVYLDDPDGNTIYLRHFRPDRERRFGKDILSDLSGDG